MEEKEKKKSGFATAALVLGIIGLCTSFIPIVNNLSFILALIGILFALVSLIKKASKKMAIASILICILTCYFTIKAQEATVDALNDTFNAVDSNLSDITGDNTDDILKNSCDVTIGNFEVIEGSYGIDDTKLSVTVKNKTSENKSFSIQIEAVNPDGSRITTDYVYANNLTAGQSQNFECFQFVSSDDLESLKNATFNIVEVSMY